MKKDNVSIAQPEPDDDDLRRNFLPTSFGKQSTKANVEAQLNQSKRTASDLKAEEATSKASDHDSNRDDDDEVKDEDESESEEDEEEEEEFPTSHEIVLKTHERAVTTATLDPSGSRLVTGSTDCTIKLHDFASMTPTTLRAFRSVDPTAVKSSAASETHPVHHVEFNPLSAGHLLVVSATPQAKILDRDGETITEFVKGDMYLRDMHNTKGHVSEITTGTWHPVDRNICVTAGTDSTLRIWDVNNKRSQKEVIVHKSRVPGSGGRSRMTAVKWASPLQVGNSVLVATALDGSLVMWSGNGPFTRPAAEIREAHVRDTWTGGLDISSDGRLVVTRGGDDTIKTWDTRKFKHPITTISHPSTSNQYPTSNIRFSPTSSSILTGSATGHLHILNPATLAPEHITPITSHGSPLITVLWHPKINQIITGAADSSTHILYSPTLSTRGVTQILTKAPKRRHIDDDPSLTTDTTPLGLSGDSIVNPTGAGGGRRHPHHHHPATGLTASGRSRDPRRPMVPAQTPFAKTQPDEKHIRKNIPLSSMRDEDPREALLKYAELAEKDPMFTRAWRETQPKTIFAELSEEEEEEEEEGQPEQKKVRR
ncbi:MAG: WD repeat-containing protein 70 [Peltula sp. TS41687]|nr:MAG: WD repeat-containing protein 70 [Peltula sp. TS41687]